MDIVIPIFLAIEFYLVFIVVIIINKKVHIAIYYLSQSSSNQQNLNGSCSISKSSNYLQELSFKDARINPQSKEEKSSGSNIEDLHPLIHASKK